VSDGHHLMPGMDGPKTLGNAAVQAARLAALRELHVAPLTDFVESLRVRMGTEHQIPFFDPWDGGIEARLLYLLEAPGPRAVRSGFVSQNNPDETAKNFFLLNQEAGIDRRLTVTWNAVPWYIGDGKRIRAARGADLAAGLASLGEMLGLLPRLEVIVFVGRKAASTRERVLGLAPPVRDFEMSHPSPMFVNRAPGNRARILQVMRELRGVLGV
jgi:uracil-DNA glycosylase